MISVNTPGGNEYEYYGAMAAEPYPYPKMKSQGDERKEPKAGTTLLGRESAVDGRGYVTLTCNPNL